MTGWSVAPLEDLLDSLIDYRGKSPPKSPSGVPVISAKVVKTTGLLRPIEQMIASEFYPTWMRRGLPRPGDVVMTTEGPLGEVIQLDKEAATFALGQRVVCLRGKRSMLDNTFLRYLLASPVQQQVIASYATGTTVAGISQQALRRVPIPHPEYAEQVRIGATLSVLDEKIDLNRRANATLEALAQAIFLDWFVDFGPVRRKMDGATDPVVIMGGLTPDLALAAEFAALFPGELGNDVPVGWRAGSLGSLAEVVGVTVNPASLSTETPYIGLEHMPRKSIALGEWEAAGKVTSQKSRFVRGQILFGKLRPYFHKVGLAPTDGVCSTDIIVLTGRGEFDRELVACYVSSDAFVAFADRGATGTKMPRTSWGGMKTYPLVIADEPVRRAFSRLVGPLHEKIITNVAESRALAETRDYLLPRLMSGEIRVGEAEALAAA
jgi:type I restriction enzyme, S subunit